MRYEPNSKHKEPWQPGRRGTLCPKWAREIAEELLESSIVLGNKRYATRQRVPFVAQRHDSIRDLWHGYPISWESVPMSIRKTWIDAGVVSRRDIKRQSRGIDEQ